MDLRVQALIDYGTISEDIEKKCQRDPEESLLEAILRLGHVSEAQYLEILAKNSGFPWYNFSDIKIEAKIDIASDTIKKYGFLPMGEEDGVLRIGIADPFQLSNLEELKRIIPQKIEFFLICPRALKLGLKILSHLPPGKVPEQSLLYDDEEEELELFDEYNDYSEYMNDLGLYPLPLDELQDDDWRDDGWEDDLEIRPDRVWEMPIEKLVKEVLYWGKHKSIQKICLELCNSKVRLRYFNGERWNYSEIFPFLPESFLYEIKMMAQLDILAQGSPQIGIANVRIGEDFCAMQVATLPTAYGEDIYIEYPPENKNFYDYPTSMVQRLEHLIAKQKGGIILVVGARRSGISSTLGFIVQRLFQHHKKILINHYIPQEICVRSNIENIRLALSTRPELFVFDDLKDPTIFTEMVQFASQGTWIIGAMHTHNAGTAASTFLDFTEDSFWTISSIRCIIEQCLLRQLCPKCKQLSAQKTFVAKGCPNCSYSGYQKSKKAIYHPIFFDDQIRKDLYTRYLSRSLEDILPSKLKEQALQFAFEGGTSEEEVNTATDYFGF